MKKAIHIILLGFVVFTISCDRIENPVVNNTSRLDWSLYPNADTTTYPWPTWGENTNTLLNVLLEDYTGHTCTNCPSAAVEAKSIEDANSGRVFVMSVHASTTSGFQEPSLPELPADHRTDAGNEYANVMNISFNPAGMVNRTISGGNYFKFVPSWAASVTTELTKSPDFNIQVKYNYYPSTNGLFVHSETEAINDVSGNFNLIHFLVRDTLVAPQEDIGGVFIEEYDHHSVLTDNINGIWGKQVMSGSIAAGTKGHLDYSYKVKDAVADTSYRINNLSIITIIANADNHEVMQVIKTPLAE